MNRKRASILIACMVCACLWRAIPAQAYLATEPTQILNNISLVAQYAKQLQQYGTQLQQYETQIQQYENMVTNTMAPYAYIWNQAQQTMSSVMGVYSQVQQLENMGGGSLEGFLQQFANAGFYESSPCFKAGGCTQAQLDALAKSRNLGSSAQLLGYGSMLQAVKTSQTQITNDAATLTTLQGQAQSATGRMQAIQAGNQLASEQAEQLLQMRALMTAQLQAESAMGLNETNSEAQKDAEDKYMDKIDPALERDDNRKF